MKRTRNLSPFTALVAADDPLVCRFLRKELRARGIVGDWVADGAEAALRLRENEYDLAFLDAALTVLSTEFILWRMDRGTLKRPAAIALMGDALRLARLANTEWASSVTLLPSPLTPIEVGGFLAHTLEPASPEDAPRPILVAGAGLWSDSLCRVLTRRGARCVSIPGTEAVPEAVEWENPSVVVFGPPINGVDLVNGAAQVCATKRRDSFTVVAALAKADPGLTADLLTIGVDRVVPIANGISRLSHQLMQFTGMRRRVHRRVPFTSVAFLSGESEILVGSTFDLSEGGVGVLAPEVHRADAQSVEFLLQGSHDPIVAKTEIAWADDTDIAGVRLGLKFRDISPAALGQIRGFVSDLGNL